MTLSAINFAVQDEAGNALSNFDVEVRLEASGMPLVSVYADRDGATPLGNPFAWVDGKHVLFYLTAGAHQIEVTKDALTRTWRHVAFGLGGETDSAPAPAQREITAAGPVTVTDTDRILLINQTVGAPITLNLGPAASRSGFDLVVIDKKGDAQTNNITIDPSGSETVNGNATDTIAVNKGSKRYLPISGGWRISA